MSESTRVLLAILDEMVVVYGPVPVDTLINAANERLATIADAYLKPVRGGRKRKRNSRRYFEQADMLGLLIVTDGMVDVSRTHHIKPFCTKESRHYEE